MQTTTQIVAVAICIRDADSKRIVYQIEDSFELTVDGDLIVSDKKLNQLKGLSQSVIKNNTPDGINMEWAVIIYHNNQHFWLSGDAKTLIRYTTVKPFDRIDMENWEVSFEELDKPNKLSNDEINELIRFLEKDLGKYKSKLYLIRGLPGTGKSTIAKQMLVDNTIDVYFEADMYFTDEDGNYKFDVKKLKDAHLWCQLKTKQALDIGLRVAVSNTFIRNWEMKTYIKMAKSYDLPVEVIECEQEFGTIHEIPESVIEKMRESMEVFNVYTID